MTVWRLVRRPFARDAQSAYSGEGAARRGGRWNSRGVHVTYASTSRALAVVELLVHVDWSDVPSDLVFIGATLPRGGVERLDKVPERWNASPPLPTSAEVGDAFVQRGRALALLVPSAVVAGEHNVLLNPLHPRFNDITFTEPDAFTLDRRLHR